MQGEKAPRAPQQHGHNNGFLPSELGSLRGPGHHSSGLLHPTLQGSSEDHRPRQPVSDPAGRQARHLPGRTRSTYSVPCHCGPTEANCPGHSDSPETQQSRWSSGYPQKDLFQHFQKPNWNNRFLSWGDSWVEGSERGLWGFFVFFRNMLRGQGSPGKTLA